MKLFAAGIGLLMVAAMPAPDLLARGAADVGKAAGYEFQTITDTRISGFGFDGEKFLVSPDVAKLVTSVQEARALAALALAYDRRIFTQAGRAKAGVAESVIAFPLALVAQNSVDQRRGIIGNAFNLPDSPQGTTPQECEQARVEQGQKRAALAVGLALKSGSCSGAMVALLNRMKASGTGSETATMDHPAGFARIALRNLGRPIYPPNESCLG